MGRGLFEGWHLIILIALLVVLFGFRRLPDAARSIGRSMRIFKSEVEEMKNDGKPSAASKDTVDGQAVNQPVPPTPPVATPAPHDTASTGNSTTGSSPNGPGASGV